MILGNYNARAIKIYEQHGKAAAWRYIKGIPEKYRDGVVSTIRTIARRAG